ncbi:DUF2279 domain-containing protein [Desulfosediminicola flagellatus]|uniref:DUF2279 domain-containing protein n=1 Tax=Desulfosediminicola flagellatus TaxID=2569541 RepID=UPI0015947C7A|nr:DUF2279 domain-containing protein [Desulfosediminicola flagellatus]
MWTEDLLATKWESGAIFGGVTVLGLTSWDWGSSNSFRINSEGWFDSDTGSGGADKLGHAFTSYAITNLLADRLIRKGRTPYRAGLNAAITSQIVMLYVEAFDGFSNDHGFSKEDVVMNMLGTGLAYARTVYPTVHDFIDFRLEYEPSGYKGFKPFSDYAGQKYLFAFKLSGFKRLQETPLRYLEFQTGYYSRGFSDAEKMDGIDRTQHAFVGVGLNFNELLFGRRDNFESEWKNGGRLFFEHFQIPNTTVRADSEI